MSHRFERRDRLRIYSDIIAVAANEISEHGEAKITRIQYRVNVPFVRFKQYIADLANLGLIEVSGTFKLTQKGEEFAREYRRIQEFYRRMGFME